MIGDNFAQTGPRFKIVPTRVHRMRLPGRVNDVIGAIASHANKQRVAYLTLETIARETGIGRSHVPALIRRAEAAGILAVTRGGGRGRATEYRIVPDEECRAQNSPTGGTVSDENSPIPCSETVPFRAQNSPTGGTPTEKRTERITERDSLSAREGAGAREGDDDAIWQQGELLLPIKGGNCNDDQRAAIANFHPPPELVDWAAREYGVDALADDVLGQFRDNQLANDKRPSDLNAAFRIWIRNERKFAARQSGRPREQANGYTHGHGQHKPTRNDGLAAAMVRALNAREARRRRDH
jgi:hypothetical protein